MWHVFIGAFFALTFERVVHFLASDNPFSFVEVNTAWVVAAFLYILCGNKQWDFLLLTTADINGELLADWLQRSYLPRDRRLAIHTLYIAHIAGWPLVYAVSAYQYVRREICNRLQRS